MKAWAIEHYGKKAKLKLMEVSTPVPEYGEVQIRLKAAGLNPVDFKLRDGSLRLFRRYRFPLVLGHEGAGVVSAIGKNVTRFKVGDEVFVRLNKERIGSLAEYAVAQESAVALKPKNISFEQAAGVPLVGLTSWQVLLEKAKMKAGDRVFVPAGSGGVGTMAIQIAKSFGATVISNTSGKNVELVKSLGADEVIDYKSQDFSKVIAPVDIVFDTVGGDTQKKSFEILKPGGRVVSIVGPPTKKLAKEWGLPWIAQMVVGFMSAGSERRAAERFGTYDFVFMVPDGETLQKIATLIETNKIHPVIDKNFSFQEGDKALEYLETGHARGKVVVTIS